jgi:hypothetical protein
MQFKAAGPMTLQDPTEDDLEILRNVVSMHSKIKYLAFYKSTSDLGKLHVIAESHVTLSPEFWCDCVHERLQDVKMIRNMQRLVQTVESKSDFEQYGTPSWKQQAIPKIVNESALQQEETSPYQIAKKYFLMTLGIAEKSPQKPESARKTVSFKLGHEKAGPSQRVRPVKAIPSQQA